MLFGTNKEFPYFKCANCGCLQIENMAVDMSHYYPAGYYSFKPKTVSPRRPILNFLKTQRLRYWLSHEGRLGKVLATISNKPEFLSCIKNARISPMSKILDIGSGSGELLSTLYQYGFKNLTGIDKYISEEINTPKGFKILKKDLSQMPSDSHFDFIMLNHSLEHMPDQFETLRKVRALLQTDRNLLVRIPIVDTYAWNTYGVHWVQLDAPRHLYLHSLKSLSILAQSTGFEITDTVFDSTEFQFWGSLQYMAGVPLSDNNSYSVNPSKSMFSKEQIANFADKAHDLNLQKQGDMACFLLTAV